MKNRTKINISLAEMLKGGVIMDVVTTEQAKIAENSGAVAVMALERFPYDIKNNGGIARMSDLRLIENIMNTVSIPVMAKVRIGHFVEAQILESLGVDFIDESEVLTPVDKEYYINKKKFKIPFVCGSNNLGEALMRIEEGASLIRTKGEAGTGNITQSIKQIRIIKKQIKTIKMAQEHELINIAKELSVSIEKIKYINKKGKLPVPNFAAGGIVTPADAAILMTLGAESIFIGSGIFKSEKPEKLAQSIVNAVGNYKDPEILKNNSRDLGLLMKGMTL